MDQLQAKLDAVQAEIDAVVDEPHRETLTDMLENLGNAIRRHHAKKQAEQITDAVCNSVRGIWWDTK